MNSFYLSEKEDLQLRCSIMLPGKRRSLYEYLCELPLETLKVYPKKGYHWWMGRAARSPQAIMLRDYILHWRLIALKFRQEYSYEYLQSLPLDALRSFLRITIQKVPIWVYEKPIQDTLHILTHRPETQE